MRMPLDEERIARRVAPLAFGIFGFLGDGVSQVARPGGSGVFIAPFLGVTARHVSEDLLRLEGRGRTPKHTFLTRHGAALFQALDPPNPEAKKALWQVTRSWTSESADLILVQVVPVDEVAKELQYEMAVAFLPWRLLPPPEGEWVHAIGFPALNTQVDDDGLEISAPFTLQKLRVGRAYPNGRDQGMLYFPCFELEGTIGQGFSGGPVVYQGHLCGIITSGSSFGDTSYAGSLWPLCLMECDSELGKKTTVGEMFDRKVILASDWESVRNRISRQRDDLGRMRVTISGVP